MKHLMKFTLALLFCLMLTPAIMTSAYSGSGTSSSPYVVTGVKMDDYTDIAFTAVSDSYTWFSITLSQDAIVGFDNAAVVIRNKTDDGFDRYNDNYDDETPLKKGTYKFGVPGIKGQTVDLSIYTIGVAPAEEIDNSDVTVSYGTTYKRIYNKDASYRQKFFFTVPADSYVTITCNDSIGHELNARVSGDKITGGYSDCKIKGTKTSKYKAGKYTLQISGYSDQGGSTGKSFTIKFTKKAFTWGKCSVTWSGNSFKISYAPGDPKTTLTSAKFDGGSHDNLWNLSGKTGSGTLKMDLVQCGYKEFAVYAIDEYFGYHKVYSTYKGKKPSKVAVNLGTVYRDNATINIPVVGKSMNGDKLYLQKKVGSTWKDVKTIAVTSTTATTKITGLSAGTTYSYRIVGCVSAKNGRPALKGIPSNVMTFKTGLSTAPAVKSVKISNAKVKKVPKTYHPGYYDAGHVWHKGYYTGGYDETTYTVTVKLKKAATGSKGLFIDGNWAAGTGKTFKVGVAVRGKVKGKKTNVSVCSGMDRNYGGYSPSVLKKGIKIK